MKSIFVCFSPRTHFLINAYEGSIMTQDIYPSNDDGLIWDPPELLLLLLLFFCFLGLHSQHMEVPRLGVELELQLPAYTTATAT